MGATNLEKITLLKSNNLEQRVYLFNNVTGSINKQDYLYNSSKKYVYHLGATAKIVRLSAFIRKQINSIIVGIVNQDGLFSEDNVISNQIINYLCYVSLWELQLGLEYLF